MCTSIRSEILTQYTVLRGVIRNPGKFEGQPLWAPYFYDLGLEGCADAETDTPDDGFGGDAVWWFRVDAVDVREAFPEITARRWVCVRADEYGNVEAWAPTDDEITASGVAPCAHDEGTRGGICERCGEEV